MKIAIFLLIFGLTPMAYSQDDSFDEFVGQETNVESEDASEKSPQGQASQEKTRILVSPDQQLIPQKEVVYKGERASLVEWEELDEKRFLDFERWKLDLKVKEQEPRWRINLQERRLLEKIGYVIECVGECRLYRGLGYARVDYLSTLREGDELQTLEDSYLWAYMMDGTLMRLSPNGSISFKEINVGTEENFIHLRLNAGNTLILSRHQRKLVPQNFKETDSLFLPLSFLEANPKDPSRSVNEDDLFAYLEETVNHKERYTRLNSLIEANSRERFKDTEFFLVMPNGTIRGRNLSAEFVVLTGNKSYFKVRDHKQLGLVGDEEVSGATFYFRGFNNTDRRDVDVGKWYEVGVKGRSLSAASDSNRFNISEFVTKNIPSILIARELMFTKYSEFIHRSLSERKLAEDHGYRRWGALQNEGSDLNLRVKYLIEFTRRMETNTLLVAEQFKRRLEQRGESWSSSEYSAAFYERAMGDFYNYRQGVNISDGRGSSLNSERKPFWKKIHGLK